jgi:two-component system, OmpR family, phosphate regulon response regulator PhoB
MTNPTVLIIEDETDLAEVISYNLHKEHITSIHAQNGSIALESLNPMPTVILLDLMLPDMSGIDICKKIRKQDQGNQTFIIMVTAKAEEIDRLRGFEVGADDYVTKPFVMKELVFRIKAALRRKDTTISEPTTQIKFGPFEVNTVSHKAFLDDNEIILTSLEFRLLNTFLTRRGAVQTREKLLEDVWNMDPNVNTRTVDKHVQRLRNKLLHHANYIQTVRGVGYRFSEFEL